MKLDGEAMCGYSTLAREPDSKSLEYNGNVVDTGGLKVDVEIMREGEHGFMSDLKSQMCERGTDPLPTEAQNENVRNLPGLDDYMDMEDSINGRKSQTGDSVTPHTVPVNDINLSEKETDFYTDKSVTRFEPLELVVCFKEGSSHVVKDICIDEGVPSVDKILVENGEVNHKRLFSSPSDLDLDVISGLSKGIVDTAAPISDEMKPSVGCDCEMDVANLCTFENLMDKGGHFNAKDEIVNEASDEKVVPENMLSMKELETENSHHESSNFDGDKSQQQSDQDTSKEANSANSMDPSASEEFNYCENANGVPIDSKVESGSITFDFDSSPAETSGREEDPQNRDCQEPVQTVSTPNLEDGILDSRTASSRSLFTQHSHGEASTSAVGTLSDLIGYSGPIPYSGSISLRSDSSSTSRRSFAFPILQSEWNSSPVKMAKPDRRHFRKHRRWWLSLLCCRF